jgi:hypothetical protein
LACCGDGLECLPNQAQPISPAINNIAVAQRNRRNHVAHAIHGAACSANADSIRTRKRPVGASSGNSTANALRIASNACIISSIAAALHFVTIIFRAGKISPTGPPRASVN